MQTLLLRIGARRCLGVQSHFQKRMSDVQEIQELINSILERAGFELRATATESDVGCLVSMEGPDSGLLLNQGGELLDALQQILNQALARRVPKGHRIVCDANNYRA